MEVININFFSIIFISIIIEGIVNYVKTIFVNKTIHWEIIVAIAIGIILCDAYNIDLFKIVGLQTDIPFIGYAATGILVSRGSNYIADLVKVINLLIKNIL